MAMPVKEAMLLDGGLDQSFFHAAIGDDCVHVLD